MSAGTVCTNLVYRCDLSVHHFTFEGFKYNGLVADCEFGNTLSFLNFSRTDVLDGCNGNDVTVPTIARPLNFLVQPLAQKIFDFRAKKTWLQKNLMLERFLTNIIN